MTGETRKGLGAGDSAVLYDLLPADLDAEAFALVRNEVRWQEMRHRGGLVPRLVAIQGERQGDLEPIYRHPADEQPALVPFTPTVERLRRIVEQALDQPLNHGLLQRYPSGISNIGAHADKTLDIARGTAVVNLSLGATRTLRLVAKDRGADGRHASERVDLPHGSLFILGWETNRRFQHAIRADRRSDRERRPDELRDGGERISLTFRTIATFLRPDGSLVGQGARQDGQRPDPHEEAEQMLLAFRRENLDSDFDWEAWYGQGFHALNFRVFREAEAGPGAAAL